ncbi:MAG: cytochrome c oxidase assembly factor Coa1 family protein [Luteolibacter sp.]
MNPAPPFPPPMPQPPPPGWWSKNWKWCVPTLVVSTLVLIAGFFALIFFAVFGMLKSSEPAKEALAKAMANPQLQSELGTPIEEGFMVSGNISTSNSSGSATLDIPVSGPKGKANIHVEARKTSGAWTYSTLEATIDGKLDRIDLRP